MADFNDMATMRNIPRNRLGGRLADLLQSVKNKTGVVGDFMLGQAPEVLDNMSYGFNPTRGAGMTYGMKPEAADLANILPASTIAALLGKGYAKLAGKEIARQVQSGAGMLGRNMMNPRINVIEDLTYGMEHRPPMKGSGAPLHDLTGKGEVYPDDVYSRQAAEYYGDGYAYDKQAFQIVNSVRNKPDALVSMYRAVPKNAPDVINNGDWVTLAKQYAKEHGEGHLEGNYKILSQKIPARKLFTNGDSIHEFGYDETGYTTPAMATTLAALSGGGIYAKNKRDKKKAK